MKEKYEYLMDAYGVELIVNPEYALKNNLHSLYLAREHLTNAYVIPCDSWCSHNPFSREEPPVQLETGMSRIPWGTHPGQPGVCAEKPESLESAGTETVRLQPYGCTTLRMTMMPDVSC